METRQVIYANEDMILTNGEIYGTVIYLADGIDPSVFYEISKEEYDDICLSEMEDIERI